MLRTTPLLLASVALLAACGSPESGESSPATVNTTADAAADQSDANPAADEELSTAGLYPGSKPSGTADRYATADPIDQVIAWYRDQDARRSQGLSFSTERRDDGYFIVGNDLNTLKSFLIHLVPAANGGTEVRLYPFDYLAKGGKL